jgi:hypothetical protein
MMQQQESIKIVSHGWACELCHFPLEYKCQECQQTARINISSGEDCYVNCFESAEERVYC